MNQQKLWIKLFGIIWYCILLMEDIVKALREDPVLKLRIQMMNLEVL